MRNFYAVDIVRQGPEHLTINSSVISALIYEHKLSRLIVSDTSSLLNTNLDGVDIERVEISSSKIFRWIISNFLTIKYINLAHRKNCNLIFMSATPINYLIINLLSIFTSSKISIYIITHGELGYLKVPNGFGQNIGALLLKLAFKLNSFSNVKYICLGFPIYKQLLNIFPILIKNLKSIEIPAFVYSLKSVSNQHIMLKNKIKIGTFGVLSADKCSSRIYDLAKRLPGECFKKIELATIGISEGDFKFGQSKFISHSCNESIDGQLIPTDTFISQVKTLDWVLMFTGDSPKYELISSGVFSDCINFEVPIIAIKSNILEEYFKYYGDLGILCDDISEMANVIQDIAVGKVLSEEFLINIKNAKNSISIENFIFKFNKSL